MSQDPTEAHGADQAHGTDQEAGDAVATFDSDDELADGATDEGGGPSLARAAGALRSWRLAWGVAVVSLLAAVVSLGWAATIAAEERRADAARERAEVVAEQVTTFRGAQIDRWVAATQELATGDYAEQVSGLFDDEFRAALRENEVESEGEVQRAYLQQLDGDTAEVFVVARQTSTNALRDEPVEDELRMDITLRYENDEWLASNIAVLNPAASPGPGDPGLDGLPEDGEDDEDGEDGEDGES